MSRRMMVSPAVYVFASGSTTMYGFVHPASITDSVKTILVPWREFGSLHKQDVANNISNDPRKATIRTRSGNK